MNRAQRKKFERFLAASVPLRDWWGMRRAMDRSIAMDRALRQTSRDREEEPLICRQMRELGW